jgi:hypothetical protein
MTDAGVSGGGGPGSIEQLSRLGGLLDEASRQIRQLLQLYMNIPVLCAFLNHFPL